jgi:NAD(P)H dehydrogenase (quinone)
LNTLVVWAHPNPESFTADWARASVVAAERLGEVRTSDLYGMEFDPVEGARHFGRDARGFDPLKAQEDGAASEDVAREIEKLEWADQVIFHFPFWWFAPPAMMKGWFDRVLVHGRTHDVDNRFDTGRFRDVRALFCVSTGADEDEAGPHGKEGDARLLLWPTAMTLRYLGMTVHEPVFAKGVHGYHTGERRAALDARLSTLLDGQADLIKTLPQRPALPFNADSDFDAQGRLKPGAPEHWPFTRART